VKEYGPEVLCPFTGQPEPTHRPAATGPWFCMACGATDHERVLAP